jgi:hypothetical protein
VFEPFSSSWRKSLDEIALAAKAAAEAAMGSTFTGAGFGWAKGAADSFLPDSCLGIPSGAVVAL